MKLNKLSLDITGLASYPVTHTEPEAEWVRLEKEQLIPSAMYRFYCVAKFFSLDEVPPFLADEHQLLFPYLGNIVRGIKDCLVEANHAASEIQIANPSKYTPVKRARGEAWDDEAPEREMRALKLFLISSAGALDGFAEAVAVLFTKELKSIRVGRAQFSKLRHSLKQISLTENLKVVPPEQHFVEKLSIQLGPILESSGPDREWLDLLLMLRNKLAHLGNLYTARMTEVNGPDGTYYTFLPRQWPFMLEQFLEPIDTSNSGSSEARNVLKSSIMHVDLPEYCWGAGSRVNEVLEEGFDVLCEAYDALKDLPCNQAAVNDLLKSREAYCFEYFSSD